MPATPERPRNAGRPNVMARFTNVIVLAALTVVTASACATASGPAASPRTITRAPSPTTVSPRQTTSPEPSSTTTSGTPTGAQTGVQGTTVTDRCPVVTEPPCPAVPVRTHVVLIDDSGRAIVVRFG